MSTAVRSSTSSRSFLVAVCALLLGFPSAGFPSGVLAAASPEAEVKAAVERFLAAAGRQDLDALPGMFAPGASIASAALREGRWVTKSQSFEAWLAVLRAAPRRAPYQEPVHEFTVHVDDGQLAFVRADAYLIRDGQRRSHNVDYFTLMRDGEGDWKFVNGSYTAKPISASAQAVPPAFDLAGARAEIAALNARFTEAHVRGDSATIDSMFTADARSLPPGATAAAGIAAIHALTMDYLRAGITEFREETVDFYGTEDYVVDEGTYLLAYGTPPVTERGKYLNVWKRVNGGWRLRTNIWNTDAAPPVAK